MAERSPSGLRIIKTHFERTYVPFNDQVKYIVVIRDPKEIIVSGYYFAGVALNALKVQYILSNGWIQPCSRIRSFSETGPHIPLAGGQCGINRMSWS
ncbi:MAG: hypothetical protein D3903_16930 [Candidatus Electrothrix sp. GM3_4]|nr:hypothetical protein [Candidatus Electrothrix sp. GM3_4]